MNGYHNAKWHITGYAMHTVAGTECDFDYERSIGFTESKETNWTTCIDSSSIHKVCKCIQETIDRAVKNAGLDGNERILSLIIASNFFENKFWEIDGCTSTSFDGNYIITYLKNAYPVTGTIICNSTACSSGASAIVTACQMIDDNKTDIAIVVGYEIESDIPKNGMRRVGALSKDRISPFSSGRSGTDIADGIGVLIIESSCSVEKRSAKVCASIMGYGVNSDAYNVTTPEPSGEALLKAMKSAINMSNVSIDKISYINSHGSGTKINDVLETKVIKEVFMDHAYKLFVNSSKSLIGHTLGAAGIIEIVITVMQMNTGKVHSTANFSGKDMECDLNYCFEKSIDFNIDYAISNSIGFGGTNVSILLESGAVYEKKSCSI